MLVDIEAPECVCGACVVHMWRVCGAHVTRGWRVCGARVTRVGDTWVARMWRACGAREAHSFLLFCVLATSNVISGWGV